MDQQNGLFGFLENHVMGPMGKLAQFKVVRAITAAGMAAVPFTIVGSMFLVFSILPQAFSFWPIVADIFIWLLTTLPWGLSLFILSFHLLMS